MAGGYPPQGNNDDKQRPASPPGYPPQGNTGRPSGGGGGPTPPGYQGSPGSGGPSTGQPSGGGYPPSGGQQGGYPPRQGGATPPGYPPQGGQGGPQQPGGYPPQGGQPYGAGGGYGPQPKKKSGMAIASMTLGIIGVAFLFTFCCWFVGQPLGIIGLILGILGLKQTGVGGRYTGRGMAIAGIILSVITLLGGAGFLIFSFAFQSNQKEAVEKFESQMNTSADATIIKTRLQQYYDYNNKSLQAGGPKLVMGRKGANITTQPTPQDLVGESETKNPVANYSFTYTGPESVDLYYTHEDGTKEKVRTIHVY